jgi:hypothetical protein
MSFITFKKTSWCNETGCLRLIGIISLQLDEQIPSQAARLKVNQVMMSISLWAMRSFHQNQESGLGRFSTSPKFNSNRIEGVSRGVKMLNRINVSVSPTRTADYLHAFSEE